MIGRLLGIVVAEEPTGHLVVDVGGVGYELATPVGSVGRAQAHEDRLVFHVHTHVREDALELYGFASELERELFRLLIGVPNVGPRTALGVLSALSPSELARAVKASDVARLTKVPSIGKKTAERLVLELKGKLDKLKLSPATASERVSIGSHERLQSALINMGYRPAEAERALKTLGPRTESEPLADLLREALKLLTP